MTHKKHVKLDKPNGGKWGRLEIAIIGAPCTDIKKMSAELIDSLSPEWEIAYVDADHNATEKNTWSALDYGAKEQMTNKVSHFEFQKTNDQAHYFNNADIVLIWNNALLMPKELP